MVKYCKAISEIIERSFSMKRDLFQKVCMIEGNDKWEQATKRLTPLYIQDDDIRNDFIRDYTRILHSTAYRRLKHKTQVFFATDNDHICTRIEHVNHVSSISDTIVKFLGLNADLTSAIAIGHDLGHAPFGHHGEKVLNEIIDKNNLGRRFWHENNGLWFIDKLETLRDPNGFEQNLNLTYAVRDGIVCHCGEVDDTALYPRDDFIDDLHTIENANEVAPFTWEGCVVKIADKISFLGRDIEDAFSLGLLTDSQIKDLKSIINVKLPDKLDAVSNTLVIHGLIIDLCKTSNPTDGISFSPKTFKALKQLREFNKNNIYDHPRLNYFKNYAKVVLESIFGFLYDLYNDKNTLKELENYEKTYPLIIKTFYDWMIKYSNIDLRKKKERHLKNNIIYNISSKQEYGNMIIAYISGMTDHFAIAVFNELISFR